MEITQSSSVHALPELNAKDPLSELLNQLPLGSALRPALFLLDDEDEAKRRWEVNHQRLSFRIVRDTAEEAVRDFIVAVDKRGLRPVLESA